MFNLFRGKKRNERNWLLSAPGATSRQLIINLEAYITTWIQV